MGSKLSTVEKSPLLVELQPISVASQTIIRFKVTRVSSLAANLHQNRGGFGVHFCHIWRHICNTFAVTEWSWLFELLFVPSSGNLCSGCFYKKCLLSWFVYWLVWCGCRHNPRVSYFNPESRWQNQWKHLKNPSTFVSSSSSSQSQSQVLGLLLPCPSEISERLYLSGAIVIAIANTRHEYISSLVADWVDSCWKRIDIYACQICDNIVNFNMKRWFFSGMFSRTNARNFNSVQVGFTAR